jgi:hypothetical protein
MIRSFSRAIILTLICTAMSLPVFAYPLDGYENTGILRLEYQRKIQEGEIEGRKRPGSGELLPLDMVRLRMLEHKNLDLPTADPTLSAQIKALIGPDVDRYGLSLLDLSDVSNPRYAAWKDTTRQNPGSVGKVLVALAIFQALADAHPDNIENRKKILRETIVTADDFSVSDHHTIGFYDTETWRQTRRPMQKGDKGSLYIYLDWMMSPSSNSAAAMLMRELILMAHYGAEYPPAAEESARFFSETPRKRLSEIFLKAIQEPITRNGLDIEEIRQGSFFTRQGKKLVPGTSSYATPRALTLFMLRMEQGRLVDEWSSLEIKRLLYVTERRIRYASSGALRPSAVYFKSGSLYSCEPEEGFVCKKYHGNKRNYMNSVAIVETAAGQDRLFYIVSVLSNVLRKNSATDHRDLARAVHSRLLDEHPAKPLEPGEKDPKLTYGEGFIGYESERAQLTLAVDTQEMLIALGYEIGSIDGRIGRNTRKAIMDFQTSQGLAADGKPSKQTLEAMQRVAQEKGLARPFGN